MIGGDRYRETGREIGECVELECKDCGALVLNIFVHDDWHRRSEGD